MRYLILCVKKAAFNDTVLKYSAVNMSVSFYEGADGGFGG